jgi:hypothetical protein
VDWIVALSGFVGAWLLVAGPISQAAIELEEEHFDRTPLETAAASVERPARQSIWWWLVPPVAFIRHHRRSEAYKLAVLAELAPEHLERTLAFFNKARSWMLVAGGAFFIAVKETWELYELVEEDLSVVVFWGALVVMSALAALTTVVRVRQTSAMLARAVPPEPVG